MKPKKDIKDIYDNSNSTNFTDCQYLIKNINNRKEINIMKIQKNWWGEKDKLKNIILKKVKLKKWYLL